MSSSSRPAFPFALLRFWTLRVLPVWCFIGGMIFLFQITTCGILHDNQNVKAFLQFIDMLPGFIKTMLGGESLQVGNITGLIAIGYNHPLVSILFMLYTVGVPTSLLAGEVQKGYMELILSRSATKTQVYICAGLITILGMLGLDIVMFLGTVTGTHIYKFSESVSLYPFVMLTVTGGIMSAAVSGISMLAAASFQFFHAIGVTVAYLVLNYFVSLVAELWPRIKWMEPYSIFYYLNENTILGRQIWPVGDMCILAAILVVTALLGAVIWFRRDLPL